VSSNLGQVSIPTSDGWKIERNSWKILKSLTESGASSTVYLVEYAGRKAAAKCVSLPFFEYFEQEMNVLRQLHHENIVRIFGWTEGMSIEV